MNANPTLLQTNLKDPVVSPLASQVLSSTYTKIQALRRLRILKQFLNFKIYDSPTHPSSEGKENNLQKLIKIFEGNYLEKSIQEENSILEGEKQKDFFFVEGLGEQFFNQFDSTNFNALLGQIEEAIYKTKTIIVYLPFEIPDKEISIVGDKVKKSFGANTLLDFKFDPQLIAGCALSFKGTYKDYSVREKIKENKQMIIDTLTTYKTQLAPQRERKVLTPNDHK